MGSLDNTASTLKFLRNSRFVSTIVFLAYQHQITENITNFLDSEVIFSSDIKNYSKL